MNRSRIIGFICILVFVVLSQAVFANNAPTVSLSSPADNAVDTDGIITFKYTPNDDGTIENCKLIVNSTIKDAKYSITIGAVNSFTNKNILEGSWNWFVSCTDNVSNVGNSSSRTIIVVYVNDSTPPSINLTTPISGYDTTASAVTFNYTPVDNQSTIQNCTLYIGGVAKKTSISISNSTRNAFTSIAVEDGTWTWEVACTDNASNTGISSASVIIVETNKPTVTLKSPSHGTLDNDGVVTFIYVPTAKQARINYCVLVMNGQERLVDNIIINATENQFRRVTLAQGTWNWSINCTDANARSGSSTNRTLYVNVTTDVSDAPSIEILEPSDNVTDIDAKVTFAYKVTHVRNILSCELILNNSVKGADNTVTLGQEATFRNIEIEEGVWRWWISCVDISNNYASTPVRTLTVRIGETPANISTEENITEEENVTITNVSANDTGNETAGGEGFAVDEWTLMIIALVIVAIIGIFILFMLLPEKYTKKITWFFRKPTEEGKQYVEYGRELDPNKKIQLHMYLDRHLKQGYNKEALKGHLVRHGWLEEHVDEAFRNLHERERRKEEKKKMREWWYRK